MIPSKTCHSCGETLRGRADKKFCSDHCRNTHHNDQNSLELQYMRNVNNILKKNRRILLQLNPHGKAKLHRNVLASSGFNFNYFTSFYTTSTGNTYYYCYEQGYLSIENDFMMLVVKKDFIRLDNK